MDFRKFGLYKTLDTFLLKCYPKLINKVDEMLPFIFYKILHCKKH